MATPAPSDLPAVPADPPAAPAGPLLSVRDLHVTFEQRGRRPTVAVDGVSFDIHAGRTVALVGESGCGKTVTSLAMLRLLPERGVRVSGSVHLQGRDLLALPEPAMEGVRGREVAMVFQDPMTSLNPVLTVGRQLSEVLERHFQMRKPSTTDEAVRLLDSVGIAGARRHLDDYPHQLSGGMRQRVMIAMALACRPKLLVADEPTTALDVTIQAQILQLLRDLIAEHDTALLMITHDLGVVAGLCETVHVMYAGRFVESAGRHELFGMPRHPYTAGLLTSIPRLDEPRGARLKPITGSPRDVIPWTSGCAFAPRCGNRIDRCTAATPALETDDGHDLRCFNPVKVESQPWLRRPAPPPDGPPAAAPGDEVPPADETPAEAPPPDEGTPVDETRAATGDRANGEAGR